MQNVRDLVLYRDLGTKAKPFLHRSALNCSVSVAFCDGIFVLVILSFIINTLFTSLQIFYNSNLCPVDLSWCYVCKDLSISRNVAKWITDVVLAV